MILFSFVLAGCNNSKTGENTEALAFGNNGAFLCPNGILYNDNNLVCFTDFGSGETTPVCNKPDCKHEDQNCLAYYDEPVFETVYNEQLYVLDNGSQVNSSILYVCNKDGSKRKKLIDLDVDGAINSTYAVTSNKLYMIGSTVDTKTNEMTFYPIIADLDNASINKGKPIPQEASVTILWCDDSSMIYSVEQLKFDIKPYLENNRFEELDALYSDPDNIDFTVYSFNDDSTEVIDGFSSTNKAVFSDGEKYITKSADQKTYWLTDKSGENKKELISSDEPIAFSSTTFNTVIFTDTKDNTTYYIDDNLKLTEVSSSDRPAFIYNGYAIFDNTTFCKLSDWVNGSFEYSTQNNKETVIVEPIVLDDDYYSKHWPGKRILQIKTDSMSVCDNITAAFNDRLSELGADYVVHFDCSNNNMDSVKDYLKELESADKGEIDIFSCGIPFEGDDTHLYSYCIDKGLCLPLTEYLNSDTGRELYEAYPEIMWQCVTRKDEIYGVSNSKDIGLGLCVESYSGDSYPDRISMLSELSEDLKNRSVNGAVFYIDNEYADYILKQNGELVGGVVPVRFENGKLTAFDPYSTEFFEDYIGFVYDGKQNGYIGTNINSSVFAGNLAPDGIGRKQIKIDGFDKYAAPIETNVWCISSFTKNAECAEDLLRLMSEDEQLNNILYYGIEGVTYTNNNGEIKFNDNDAIWATENTFGNELLLLENIDYKKQYESYDSDLVLLDLSKYDFSAFDNELVIYKEIIGEYSELFIGNVEDYEDELSELQGRLKSAGYDETISKINEMIE